MTSAIFGVLGIGLGAWLTYRFGLHHARLQNASSRRLSWLEGAQAQLLSAAGDLQNARAAGQAGIPAEQLDTAWSEALRSISRLRDLELEAEAYLPNSSAEAVSEAVNDILRLTAAAGRLGASGQPQDVDHLFEIVGKLLYHAASRIAGDIRLELGLDELSREWRLYDREIRDLHAQIGPMSDGSSEGEDDNEPS